MLMKTRAIDFLEIEDCHQTIHKALENWARWVQVRSPSWVSPMFLQAQSNARQWHQPEIRETCDILGAMAMEKAVGKLPEAQRAAIRWFYVYQGCPLRKARKLGVHQLGLKQLVRDGRAMLCRSL
jgi:hypothetical protein